MLPNCQLVLVGDMVGKDEILRALIAASSNFNSVCELQRAFWCTQRCVGVSVSDDMVRNFFIRMMGSAVWENWEAGRGCTVSRSRMATSNDLQLKFFLFCDWFVRLFVYYRHYLDFADTEFSSLPLFCVTKLLKCFFKSRCDFLCLHSISLTRRWCCHTGNESTFPSSSKTCHLKCLFMLSNVDT